MPIVGKVVGDRSYVLISAHTCYIFIIQSKRNGVYTSMQHPKGSKNKTPRKTPIPTVDFTTLNDEKSSTKEALLADIVSLEENLTVLKVDLKAKKAELKKLDNELAKLEEQKAAFDAAQAEEAKKVELEETIQKLMADGMSAGEILEKLK